MNLGRAQENLERTNEGAFQRNRAPSPEEACGEERNRDGENQDVAYQECLLDWDEGEEEDALKMNSQLNADRCWSRQECKLVAEGHCYC